MPSSSRKKPTLTIHTSTTNTEYPEVTRTCTGGLYGQPCFHYSSTYANFQGDPRFPEANLCQQTFLANLSSTPKKMRWPTPRDLGRIRCQVVHICRRQESRPRLQTASGMSGHHFISSRTMQPVGFAICQVERMEVSPTTKPRVGKEFALIM